MKVCDTYLNVRFNSIGETPSAELRIPHRTPRRGSAPGQSEAGPGGETGGYLATEPRKGGRGRRCLQESFCI